MNSGMYPLVVVLPLVLLLSGVICRAAGSGRIGRNLLVGYRLRSLLASDRAWRAGHAAAEAPSWAGFLVTAASAVLAVVGASVFLVLECVAFVLFFGWAILNASRAASG
ncbi:SdpI family protein [Kribbella sp.]|uniref:SdpI family protein n=1 Tax=Kribbella sp. TaxID=1871183 RepID=UPI002D6F1019|nr:SdpI family protein [Kribbella sp.]HZX03395.1 SdpI family protein [Kribbella sp.]